ncbi:nuclear transport factor 2 family protein [Paraburkholderia sediminicola]|uniref:nuclear transport factor 2 family protein n=1 Tax=Paraburkholderia sediminicola TaxID=458836 RepID=UPI0038B83555
MNDSDKPFSQVLEADDARYRAMIENDLERLDALLDPELLYTHSSAVTDTKEQYIDSLRSGRVIYRTIKRLKEIFRESGGVVLMAGHVLIAATVDGKDRLLDNKFLTTWVQKDQNWKLLSWASTPTSKA